MLYVLLKSTWKTSQGLIRHKFPHLVGPALTNTAGIRFSGVPENFFATAD